jgi:membrane-associated protease RseP (regulator of RpoE activity)
LTESGLSAPGVPAEPIDFAGPLPVRPPKFQNRLWLHWALFALTLASTTLIGADHYAAFAGEFGRRRLDGLVWTTYLVHGFWYSVTLLSILGAHEMGHYLYCRRYDVDATLPFFIPMPLVLTGTLGAVIRIREAFPTRKVLFDIGVAGPLAGFAVIVPALFLGLSLSTIVPEPTQGGIYYLGEPLLFKLAAWLVFGPVKDGLTINLHPIGFAAWFGLFATALNLLPFGQLDGGHITYSTLGRRSTPISIATVSGAVAMTFLSISWLVMTVIMVVMMFMFGPHHPRVIYEHEPIGRGRVAVAVLALVVFIVSFTPIPIDVQQIIRNP